MFDGFILDTVQVPETTLRVRSGGSGPTLLAQALIQFFGAQGP